MAKAKAICKCRKCGATFESTKICYNRKEADNWEAWASEHFDLCPDCYAKEQSAKAMNSAEVVEMHYSEYKNKYSNKKTVPGSYNPATKTIKVIMRTAQEIALAEAAEKAAKAAEKKADKKRKAYERAANASKSEIFTKAHEQARKMRAANPGMSYREAFSKALKFVYALVKEAKAALAA